MTLNGKQMMDMYEVTTTKSSEPVYILARDLEEAAWKASQVSGGVNYLKNVTLHQPDYLYGKETLLP